MEQFELLLNVDMGYANDPERQVQAFMQEYQNLTRLMILAKNFA